ncbi:cytochrome c biogenesis protein ResB [Massilia sp. PAMC28688]|uniref:cytochrome c biogenesis protein ResB n=1 Tax=Massilia sp. PAMC28688 TaxID=2861283 RepID=UPI001C631A80|nr:cytochrome c biogenesis protein ResB [Massilia sp. PAMC28688]QYF94784.1 cytochrome c biogenesis protein ResB [Massilia sp. PAMC28688]
MSTTGIELRSDPSSGRRSAFAEAVELVSSMRFAITMLVMIMIASIIGTVLTQNQPMPNYVNQFGPFWFEIFGSLGLYAIYSTWWFILILALLLLSTTFCILRNTPRMLRDMRSWRENVREVSLRNFHHQSEWVAPLAPRALAEQTAARLHDAGYGAKIVDKGNGILVAAKKGAANKFGYIFAHSAIIIILVGGMLDSDLPIQFQERFLGKTAFQGGGLISAIPAQHRLSVNNPTYRANTMIPEGQSSDIAIISRGDGSLLQPLPFTIELKRFVIDFYSTGMPKLFASDVVIRDHETGKRFASTIRVNEPLIYKGVAIYQSSFEDGGTKLTLTGFPMSGTSAAPFAMQGEINTSTPLTQAGGGYDVEWSDFRAFNVENVVGAEDVRGVKQRQSLSEQFAVTLDKHSGSAANVAANANLKNVGPSVQYKLRDKTGQAREYQNYMQPVTIDGAEVFLAGVRSNPNDAFSYLRIPSDDAHTVKEWMRLRAALSDPALRALAAERFARRAMPATTASPAEGLARQLQDSVARALDMFAGVGSAEGGYVAVSRFLDRIPAAEQKKQADIFMKLLNGALWELWQAAREKDGLPALEFDQTHARFLALATNALSDSFFYGAPVYLQLDDFVQVKASVLQVTRSPGKFIVYLGSLLLVLGVFAMFYIRERRLWVWVRSADDGQGAHALMAMSTQRKTLDFEHEFNDLKAKLPQSA